MNRRLHQYSQHLLRAVVIFTMPLGLVSAAQPNPLPRTLYVAVDSFPSPTYLIKLKGRTIYYEEYRRKPDLRHDGSTYAKITPTRKQWKAFRRDLDAIGVWRWQSSYDSVIADGESWTLKVTYSDHSIDSRGSNNFPDKNGAPSSVEEKFPDFTPTPTFESLLQAIRKLIGEPPFKF